MNNSTDSLKRRRSSRLNANACNKSPRIEGVEYASDFSDLLPRYSRQMLLPQLGPEGQRAISQSKVLVVGAGGIGSSLIMYLAGAGVGQIDIVDFDIIELSNLHRQVIHDSLSQGINKSHSAMNRVLAINPDIKCNAINKKLCFENAIEIINSTNYSAIIDCTDNQLARYILNDVCVLLRKPLVHGSAIGMEGQMTIFSPYNSPCYRCIHPVPSNIEGCRSCANSGVLGPVPGLIGILQAIETLKLLVINFHPSTSLSPDIPSSPHHSSSSTTANQLHPLIGKQLHYDATTGEFTTFHLPSRDLQCAICSADPTIRSMEDSKSSLQPLLNTLINPECNSNNTEFNISVIDYSNILKSGAKHILLDVRSALQFQMISLSPWLPKAANIINIPYNLLKESSIGTIINQLNEVKDSADSDTPTYVLCRRGNDSLRSTKLLRSYGLGNIFNIAGGLGAWASEVDTDFPVY